MLVHQCTMSVLSKLTVYSLDSTVYHISSSKVVHINWHGLCIGLSIINDTSKDQIMSTLTDKILYWLYALAILVVWLTL